MNHALARAHQLATAGEREDAMDIMRGAHIEGTTIRGTWSELARLVIGSIARSLAGAGDIQTLSIETATLMDRLQERKGKAVPAAIREACSALHGAAIALAGLVRLEEGKGDDTDLRRAQQLRSRWTQVEMLAGVKSKRAHLLIQRAGSAVLARVERKESPSWYATLMERALAQWRPLKRPLGDGERVQWTSDDEWL